MQLSGPSLPPADGKPARGLVILLHGLGADGNDLIGLAPHWARLLPHVTFVSPNAPFPCDMAPYGYQWFSLQDRTPARVVAGVRAAWPILDAFIDAQLAAHKLTEDRLALVGFSQGCMMSLFTAPRRKRAVAGVVGYSGRLIDDGTLEGEIASRPPMLLVHGTEDAIVPYESLALSQQGLESLEVPVETLSCPGLGHGIDPAGLEAGGAFLKRMLAD
ncbi:MAG: alpha/beta hydrolase [Oceanibaculum sp.]